MSQYYHDIPAKQQHKWASQAVLAQEKYLVLQCNDFSNIPFEIKINNTSATKLWVLPEVLGKRDIILVW